MHGLGIWLRLAIVLALVIWFMWRAGSAVDVSSPQGGDPSWGPALRTPSTNAAELLDDK
jgi:hypothetical protein